MADASSFEGGLWQEFLSRHVIGITDQEAFLDYLTRPGAQAIESLSDLEDAYREFLRTGSPPVDL
jgi:hypothetical protein